MPRQPTTLAPPHNPHPMRALIIASDGEEGGLVVLEVDGQRLGAMDCTGYGHSEQAYPEVGSEFTPKFACLFGDDASWSSVFSGNPEHRSEVVSTGAWSYRAFGKLISVDIDVGEAVARCGPCDLPLPIEVSDPALIGASVAFDVQRLDVWRA